MYVYYIYIAYIISLIVYNTQYSIIYICIHINIIFFLCIFCVLYIDYTLTNDTQTSPIRRFGSEPLPAAQTA